MVDFMNAPNRCFFGLDKAGSHGFTVPSHVKNELINMFQLNGENLQKVILLSVDDETYSAEMRLGRILNIRPHRLRDRKKTDVLKFQWAKFDNTKLMIRERLRNLRERVLNGEINRTEFVRFKHIKGNTFQLSFGISELLPGE